MVVYLGTFRPLTLHEESRLRVGGGGGAIPCVRSMTSWSRVNLGVEVILKLFHPKVFLQLTLFQHQSFGIVHAVHIMGDSLRGGESLGRL